MNTKKHHWILYLISITIVATITIQFYWNYKNYRENKQRIVNEIQQSLDDAIEIYYTDLTKKRFFTFSSSDSLPKKTNAWSSIFSNLNNNRDSSNHKSKVNITSLSFSTDSNQEFKEMDSIFTQQITNGIKKHHKKIDSSKLEFKIKQITQSNLDIKSSLNFNSPNHIKEIKVFNSNEDKIADSLKLIKGLQTIFISVQDNSLNHNKLDSLIKKQLFIKGISTPFYINHFKHDTLFYSSKKENSPVLALKMNAKSTYVKSEEKLSLQYENPTHVALKRSSTGILLSLLLALAVISSLFYLLKIINQQKELAEIKNDLISNITHEFKTPITTVSTALEAISNFNAINDIEKTKKYLTISSVQVEKLNLMVEKLLETATLNSEKLLLKKEPINLVELIENNVKKHQFTNSEKTIQFSTNKSQIITNVDSFHFENAISNLLDNAIKYGGDIIEVHINQVLNIIEIAVADNGKGIDKHQQEKIFDKFYRIPKGNTHDVKGFGIGLYYTKKIVEKHGGTISLASKLTNTLFKIVLNYE
ncbi:sensor histidine kinase KdpD [Tenacibaculum sp. 47A_GOM-205m]|uniref:sensor histidine kinase n=1 Tax=Tenacibaculum sp. 47A_GOM-205m TaxID=1380384 RepID=UPI00048CF585|nr:HAMP domain-containing sensor histidine kinase [Tenacibaculum sp. 47A_GOM-205m]